MRSHPYIRLEKGKQEQYLKDDEELAQFQTQVALEEASLHVSKEAPGIIEQALEELVNKYRSVQNIIKRHSQYYPEEVLQALVSLRPLDPEDLKSEEKVQSWVEELQANVAQANVSGALFVFSSKYDEEEKLYEPLVTSTIHGVKRKVAITPEFFKSLDYKEIYKLGDALDGLFEEGAYVQRGEKQHVVTNFKEALTWLMADGMKGHYLQRYKGLGEMNPGQLWETTMDPSFRRMAQVTIHDAMAADQLFSTLMGDQVEPRREFIETNALTVSNLDI